MKDVYPRVAEISLAESDVRIPRASFGTFAIVHV